MKKRLPIIDAGTEHMAATYRTMMIETKNRTDAFYEVAKCACEGHIHPTVGFEYGYLQLRMICELIILGCLVAHNETARVRSSTVRREWKLNTLVKTLEGIHTDFYPHPVRIETVDGIPKKYKIVDVDHLTKDDLLHLHGRICGDRLHMGSIHGAFSPNRKPPKPLNYDDINKWFVKIIALTTGHRIALKNSHQDELWFVMRSQAHDEPQTWLMGRDQPSNTDKS